MSGRDASRIKSLFQTLDQTHRLILMLFYVDRLTPAEIGAVLDLTETQVGHIIDRSRECARRAISPAPLTAAATVA